MEREENRIIPGRQAIAGHTLAEYVIIGVLVAILAIPALMLLGRNISAFYAEGGSSVVQADGLFSLLTPGGSGGNGAGTGTGTVTGAGGDDPVNPGDSGGGLGGTGTAIMSSSVQGQEEFVRMIEEHGAGYVTSLLLSDLDQTINALEASGEISAEQAALLRQLSGRGHHIADIEMLISQSFASGQTTGLMLNGQAYSRDQLMGMIGWTGYNPTNFNNSLLTNSGSPYLSQENRAFLETYDAVMASLSDNPELAQWVTGLSGEILLLTESVEDTTMGMGVHGWDPQAYNALVASTITHYDSDLFCNAGAGDATGTSCGG